MILVTRVDAGAVVEQQPCRCNVAGEVERRASITPFGINQRRIAGEHPQQMIGEAKAGRCMHRERCAALDKVSRHGRIDPARVKTGGPPITDRLQVFGRAGLDGALQNRIHGKAMLAPFRDGREAGGW